MVVPRAPHGGRVGRGPEMEAVASKESWNAGGGASTVVAAAVKGSLWQ
jgi:hypothetical protein